MKPIGGVTSRLQVPATGRASPAMHGSGRSMSLRAIRRDLNDLLRGRVARWPGPSHLQSRISLSTSGVSRQLSSMLKQSALSRTGRLSFWVLGAGRFARPQGRTHVHTPGIVSHPSRRGGTRRLDIGRASASACLDAPSDVAHPKIGRSRPYIHPSTNGTTTTTTTVMMTILPINHRARLGSSSNCFM